MFKKKKIVYDFNYKIIWKSGEITRGNISHSSIPPEKIFLRNIFTYFDEGIGTYFNKNEIKLFEVTDLVEKVDDE